MFYFLFVGPTLGFYSSHRFRTSGFSEVNSSHQVACILINFEFLIQFAVNDPFVMKAWAKTYPDNKDVKFLADGSASYTRALGLELDLSEKGLGTRSKRFAMVVDDLEVKVANIEAGGEFTISSADDILKTL